MSVDFKWADILLKAGGNFALGAICLSAARNALACTEPFEIVLFGWLTAMAGIFPMVVGALLIVNGIEVSHPWIGRYRFFRIVLLLPLFVAAYGMQVVIAGNFSLVGGVCGDYFIPWVEQR